MYINKSTLYKALDQEIDRFEKLFQKSAKQKIRRNNNTSLFYRYGC